MPDVKLCKAVCSPNPLKVLTHHHIISGSYAASCSLGFGGTSLRRLQRPIGLGLSVSVSPLPRPPSGDCDLPGSPGEQGLEPETEAGLRQEDLERAGCLPGTVPPPHGWQGGTAGMELGPSCVVSGDHVTWRTGRTPPRVFNLCVPAPSL